MCPMSSGELRPPTTSPSNPLLPLLQCFAQHYKPTVVRVRAASGGQYSLAATSGQSCIMKSIGSRWLLFAGTRAKDARAESEVHARCTLGKDLARSCQEPVWLRRARRKNEQITSRLSSDRNPACEYRRLLRRQRGTLDAKPRKPRKPPQLS
jgi:hypothetical protein